MVVCRRRGIWGATAKDRETGEEDELIGISLSLPLFLNLFSSFFFPYFVIIGFNQSELGPNCVGSGH